MTNPFPASAPHTSKRYQEVLQLATMLTRMKWSTKPEVWKQEVTSRVLMKYLTSFGESQPPDNLRAWLRRVIWTTGIDLDRAEQVHPEGKLPERTEVLPGGSAISSWLRQAVINGPSKQVARRDLINQVLGLVEPELGILIKRKYVDNLSSLEIAHELGINEANVNTRLTRAKLALRTALVDRPDLVAELHAPMPQAF